MLTKDLMEQARRRFDFERWRGANSLSRNLFIWRFGLQHYELTGWQLVRSQLIELPGTPPQIQTVWSKTEGHAETLLRIDVFDCASRLAAHEFMLELLANFESPMLQRDQGPPVGDVAFVGPPNPWVIFARANLVVLLRNAGRVIVPLTEPAVVLDSDLKKERAKEPVTARAKTKTEAPPSQMIRRFEAKVAQPKLNAVVPLELDVAAPKQSSAWFKIFSDGEVVLEKRKLVYRPVAAKPDNLVLVSMVANRHAERRVLRLTIKK